MKFSIIVPLYNSGKYLEACLDSIRHQDIDPRRFEALVIDDCSTDRSVALASTYAAAMPNLHLITLAANSGPGIARNAGLRAARGEWVLFLDSDDELGPDCLSTLDTFLVSGDHGELDALGFDWASKNAGGTLNSSKRVGRRDGAYLADHDLLIRQYLSHRMDGSVIFTALRLEMIRQFDIRFAHGLHEDADFIFVSFYYSRASAYLDRILYYKRNHAESIINGVSERHIDGYFRAWTAIGRFLASVDGDRPELLKCYRHGTIAAIATRVREVLRHGIDIERMAALFRRIRSHACALFDDEQFSLQISESRTVYYQIAASFLRAMTLPAASDVEKAAIIRQDFEALRDKSWSCTDLHHSLFLRPDEVRTCCKRFFVDGERRGDVSLFPVTVSDPVAPQTILAAKRALYQAINSGEPTPCDGCPFLEFKPWSPLNHLDIRTLSLEHHSICNLHCSYCSEDYFGGKTPIYDVAGTIAALVGDGALAHHSLIVWGGGEPVVAKDFAENLTRMADVPGGAQQRVLTNALKFSPPLRDLLARNLVQIVTSIDAGTEATFEAVRGRPGLNRVCSNLRAYADASPDRVTIKYIFTNGNMSLGEVQAFAALMQTHRLLGCNFQISTDFSTPSVEAEALMSMVVLFGLLRKAGAVVVYFDELLRDRLACIDMDDDQLGAICHLAGAGEIATPARYPRVVVWGAGQQARFLMEGTRFFKAVEVPFFVDATPEKQGTRFFGKEILAPSALLTNGDPVLIAAVQGYPLILEQFRALGLPDSRLIRALIL